MTALEIAELAVFCALMVGGKEAMNSLPNIHPVMLFIILCVKMFRAKALYPVAGFVIIETLLYGISLWTVCYFYIWPLYTIIAVLCAKNDSKLFWALFAGICGLLFGALSAFITLALSGFQAAVAYWVAGIPFDAVHCVSNFVMVLLLYEPLLKLLNKLRNKTSENKEKNNENSIN